MTQNKKGKHYLVTFALLALVGFGLTACTAKTDGGATIMIDADGNTVVLDEGEIEMPGDEDMLEDMAENYIEEESFE